MKIKERCICDPFPVTSSRWAHLPKVHVQGEDGSVWHGYDNAGVPIKESLWKMSAAVQKEYAARSATEQEEAVRAATRETALQVLREKRKSGKALTAKEQQELLDLLLGI